jgi:hypothetical protein
MHNTKEWDCLPSGNLTEKVAWRSLGENRFAALRVRLLIVRRNINNFRYGNEEKGHLVAHGDEITLTKKRERIISHTDTIVQAIRLATTSRICETLSAKLTSELAAKVAGYSAKVGGEFISSQQFELTDLVETSLQGTSAYMIQEIESSEHVITIRSAKRIRDVILRRRFWERQIQVYLHSFDYLELSFRRNWYWRQFRDSFKETSSGVLGLPLVSIQYFEPQEDLDICYKKVVDELEFPAEVNVMQLETPMPRSIAPEQQTLESLAKIAFPITKSERKLAVTIRDTKVKAAAPKAPAKKVAKKAPAKKAVKKAAPKAPARKASVKKTAKKAARKMAR